MTGTALAIDTVRSFNRVVTERVGALDDRFLARRRPLGEARLLWEVGEHGALVRDLRARLGLDSGYLSRMLRSLERAGLVEVVPAVHDRRSRLARLTPRGAAERHELDRRSDAAAAAILTPLTDRQRAELVAAMATVERLLLASMVDIGPADPAGPAARHCLESYARELDARFDSGFEAARSLPAEPDELRPPRGLLLVATVRGRPIGCGAVKLHGAEPAELKRMWVDPEARGLGVGARLLAELEARAAERGATAARLETNRALSEAIALYRARGYTEVAPFNDEPYADHWFEKPLPPPPAR